ncbi:uncharacterized protein [Phyllobates terribilis]|uniref:uncharacterized protein isoform X1 n=1 Tax=Phyllobates terribilis TaxID=111132 RepID=UPI003CCB1D8C
MKAVQILVLAALLPDIVLAPPHKVIPGIPHSTIHLQASLDRPPTDVIWKHKTTEDLKRIAKIQNGSMIERLNSRYTLGDNGRDLYIHNVTECDNGEYIADYTLANGTEVKETFYLLVHEPVPPARIIPEERRSGDQCNITLHCSVPSNSSDLSYSCNYTYQDQSTDVAGSTIQKTVPLDHKDIEFVCTVRNPADSVHVEQCSEPVPPARIIPEERRSGDQCNITLHCSVPSNSSDLSYSCNYTYQDQSTDVAGSTIQKTVPLDHKDIEFVCTVNNPADSVHVEQCSEKVKTRSHVPICVAIMAAFSVMVWIYSKRSGQGVAENETLTSPVQDSDSECRFNSVSHGKTYMKTKEEDEER